MIYFLLAYEFLKIGFFSFGGGYATIPFLYDISVRYGWYTIKELATMTAVASITPGPVGINAATYAGMKTAGILGALMATLSEVLPSLIIVIVLSKILKKYRDDFYVKAVLETLKPIGCALLTSVVIGMMKPNIHDIDSILLLGMLLLLSLKTRKDTIFYILIGAFAGIIKVLFFVA